jgi:hypothetical protein
MIDVEELIKAFKDLGVEVDKNEATKLLQRYFLMFGYFLFSAKYVFCWYGLNGCISYNLEHGFNYLLYICILL